MRQLRRANLAAGLSNGHGTAHVAGTGPGLTVSCSPGENPGDSRRRFREAGPIAFDRLQSSPVTQSRAPESKPPSQRNVEYKGAPLDAEKGPGLGCFWLQVVLLAIVVVLTPLSAAWEWPVIVTIVLMATTLVLLLFVGQTVIFLLRLVAADRRAEARRRPLQSRTKTVGEIEDEAEETAAAETGTDAAAEQPEARDAGGDDRPG